MASIFHTNDLLLKGTSQQLKMNKRLGRIVHSMVCVPNLPRKTVLQGALESEVHNMLVFKNRKEKPFFQGALESVWGGEVAITCSAPGGLPQVLSNPPPPPRSHDLGQYDRTHTALQASVALSLEKEEDKAELGHGTRAQVVKVNACFYLGK